jgi:hypothetical protein
LFFLDRSEGIALQIKKFEDVAPHGRISFLSNTAFNLIFMIKIGSFEDEYEARDLADSLKEAGIKVEVKPIIGMRSGRVVQIKGRASAVKAEMGEDMDGYRKYLDAFFRSWKKNLTEKEFMPAYIDEIDPTWNERVKKIADEVKNSRKEEEEDDEQDLYDDDELETDEDAAKDRSEIEKDESVKCSETDEPEVIEESDEKTGDESPALKSIVLEEGTSTSGALTTDPSMQSKAYAENANDVRDVEIKQAVEDENDDMIDASEDAQAQEDASDQEDDDDTVFGKFLFASIFAGEIIKDNNMEFGKDLTEEQLDPLISVVVSDPEKWANNKLAVTEISISFEKMYEVFVDLYSTILVEELGDYPRMEYGKEMLVLNLIGMLVNDILECSEEKKMSIDEFEDACQTSFDWKGISFNINAVNIADDIRRSFEKGGVIKVKGNVIKWKI